MIKIILVLGLVFSFSNYDIVDVASVASFVKKEQRKLSASIASVKTEDNKPKQAVNRKAGAYRLKAARS